MANMEQQMCQMFIHLGFSQAVMTSIIDDHSIVTLTDLLHFEPVHQVQTVSTSLHHATTMPSSLLLQEVSPVLCDCTFATNMQDAVQVSYISSLKTLPQDHLDPQTLANNWGIGIETAK